jgi:hypothetical protein
MSEAGSAVLTKPEQKAGVPDAGRKRVTELRVTGHLMTLETGVFCVFQAPGSTLARDETGLPGVRISLPPGTAGNPDAVSISTFRADGWLSGRDPAALVRVTEGPAQVLVTVYQSPAQGADAAPRLQVLRLSQDAAAAAQARSNGLDPSDSAVAVVAHVQRTGDVGAKIGDWLGEQGSKLWIEGFAVTPPDGIPAEDIEYQAVLGRGWNSPWMEGGTFCGSRGMALPLLGVRLRLKGDTAKAYTLRYAASFIDGTVVGPVESGESCETESLAALEAMQVLLEPRGGAAKAAGKSNGKANGKMAASPPTVSLPDLMDAATLTGVTPAMSPRPKPPAVPRPVIAKKAAAKGKPVAAARKKPAPAGRRPR